MVFARLLSRLRRRTRTAYTQPGVYIEERASLPPSVSEVATAIPAFIGYTEKAQQTTSNDLVLQPTRIESMSEYEQYFGQPKDDSIAITVSDAAGGGFAESAFAEPVCHYRLHYSMRLFFDNGGGPCYVVSAGTYQTTPVIGLRGDGGTNPGTCYGLQDGLDALEGEDEPTLIVIPDAVELTEADYSTLVQAVLQQCNSLQDRFAIHDIYGGDKALSSARLSRVRGHFGSNHLKYGAAYYPFLRTSLHYYVNEQESNVSVTYNHASAGTLGNLKAGNTALYQFVKSRLAEHAVVLPPSAAVAGAYAATDRDRGVWKAPANISLAGVREPAVRVDDGLNQALNIDAAGGKSVNTIRAFAGKGTLIWGARTLAGNDNEWRYVPVRRLFIMLEESLRKSTAWVVFEPNDAGTWTRVRTMIENFLVQKWREGALQGSTPEQALYVRCGLGSTMTQQDILQGRLVIEIGLAAIRPAEFTILKISQKMQPA